jgi:hypothetical protein
MLQKEVIMLLEGKIKKAALMAAIDVCLRRMKNSPKRCARNMIELGLSAYPDKRLEVEQCDLYKKLLASFEQEDVQEARSLFSSVFL